MLGLTADRIHYTKTLHGGDVLTSRQTPFYDPIVVELLVTSCLAILASLWFSALIIGGVAVAGLGTYAFEQVCMWILWVMFLVGSAIFVHKFPHLKFCRGSHRFCGILETIKAFSFILWILLLFLITASIANMFMNHHDLMGPVHGRSDTGTYPNTTATTTTTAAPANPYPETRAVDPASRATQPQTESATSPA
ncbi:uncharacterized protein LACBIDRAFT_307649 [Laccaria bicolor S238N-H82]|uniref:Predicted protein n=1 Tax=Laccaria bicolor (strain S238N-H82 / ATCC MYA-4686) TaxID=486041 RepID=B0DQN6_LACBS|nr:uncharacterized protein LACBIDRAFT_307649 [Laccaria bicolor S238N-H82]EDR03064.1 predicted protein [Laccaria bicolor S238N-H82]|eukprot:XP_001886205.1 predicted protein [Laccaria bicolor S238N-H82]